MPTAPFPETVPALLTERVGATPDRVACYHKSATTGSWVATTWRELEAETRRAAGGLRALGLRPGDRLAVLARTRREWLAAELAALRAGAVVVGVDPHAPPEQAEFVLRHSEARHLIAESPAHLEKLPPGVRAGLTTVLMDGADGRAVRWEELAASAAGDGLPAVAPSDPATLVYTAGTTGVSKGVGYTHRQLLVACEAIIEVFPQIGDGDTTLCWLPMAHLFQRMLNLWAAARGMTTYFCDDPRAVLDVAGEVRPSFLAAVPRLYEKLAQAARQAADPAAEARRLTGGNVKFMLTGSAPLPGWVGEYLHGLGLLVLEAYGVTENTIPMAANRVDAYRFGSVGRPFPGNEIRFADDGEILVRGDGVFGGYYQEEGQSAGLFTPDGFYRTGDLGTVDADGFLYLVGRKAEILKTSTGRRIAPARVEAVYGQSPHFDQVVVFGHGRKHLVALVGLKGGPPPGGPDDPAARTLVKQELDRLGGELAPHERVADFAILPEPLTVAAGDLTPTLKLRRSRIEARFRPALDRLYHE